MVSVLQLGRRNRRSQGETDADQTESSELTSSNENEAAQAEANESTIFIARQPIFDRNRRTFCQQLLHHSLDAGIGRGLDPTDGASSRQSNEQTQQLVENTLLQWGIDKLLDGLPGLVHVDAQFMSKGHYMALPARDVILEVRGDHDLDGIVYHHVLKAKAAGFRLALSHVENRRHPLALELATMADVIKVDLSNLDANTLELVVGDFRSLAPKAKLLAERVEEPHEFALASDLGFDLFGGYFFAKPEILSRSARAVSSTSAIALIAEIHNADVSMHRLEQLVMADPTVAFRLLALVNSSANGLASRVESVYHALVLLGTERVRQLATLIAMSSKSPGNEELLALAATRASMARALIDTKELQSGAYTAGLLSVVDVIFGIPMSELVDELPLSPTVADALRDRSGPIGDLLQAIQAYERADLHGLEVLRPGELARFLTVYREAAAWSQGLRKLLSAA
jgi:c-di-GMP phosphodiesterase